MNKRPWALLGAIAMIPGLSNAQCLPEDKVALLLPAVQKVRDAAARINLVGSGSLDLHLSVETFTASDAATLSIAADDFSGDRVDDIVVGAGPGGGPHVRVISGTDGAVLGEIFPYDPEFTGGVSVATGDVNDDGMPDIITGAGPGGGPHVKVYSGATIGGSAPPQTLHDFFAFRMQDPGGATVAAGDFDGDGHDDLAVATGPGQPAEVRIFSGATGDPLATISPFDGFQGGVRVAVGDVNNDQTADILVATADAPPLGEIQVRVFDGSTVIPVSLDDMPVILHELSEFAAGSDIQPVVGDFDSDGRSDSPHFLLAVGEDIGIEILEVDGISGQVVDVHFIEEPAPGNVASVALATSRTLYCHSFEAQRP